MVTCKPLPRTMLMDLSYDPETGHVIRMYSSRRADKINCRADKMRPNSKGKMRSRINYRNKVYYTSRVAWLLMTGEDPTGVIDHKDEDPSNNKWDNLIDTTQKENIQNHFDRSKDNQIK